MRGLVREKLRFRGQRQALEVVPTAHAMKTLAPERIGRQHVSEPRAQLAELQSAQLVEASL